MNFLQKSVISKMILLFLVLIPIPLLIAGVALSKSFLNLLVENNQRKNLQLTEEIAKKIDDNNLQFIFSVSSIMNDNDIIPSVVKWNTSTNRFSKFELSRQIDKKLSYYFNYTTDLIGVYFIFRDNSYYFYRNPLPIDVSTIKSQPWYREMKARKEFVKVVGKIKNSRFTENQNNGKYSIAIAALNKLSEDIATNDVEMVFFTFSGNTYQKSSKLNLSKVGKVDIVTNEGEPVSNIDHTMTEVLKKEHISEKDFGSFRYKQKHQDILITYYSIPSTNWKVINSISYKELTGNFTHVMFVVIAFLVAITIIFIIIFFTSIMGTVILPIKRLIGRMKRVEEGDFRTGPPDDGEDEIALLNMSFAHMVNEIQNLIVKIDNEKTEKLQLEIKALQYQINPHFLFNTLNSITMMADMYGVNNIKKMTDALTKLLQNTLGKGSMFTTLEKEFETLTSYAYIMKLRYGDKFDITYNVADQVNNFMILKLLLQPIVENSILHGMSGVFDKLLIHIEAKQADLSLIITITDNGVGMTPEQITSVLQEKESQGNTYNRIGLYNVHQRIRLNHGDKYGITITSTLGQGTTVALELPIIPANKEEEVSNA
jgi:two-component system sensor histidine kinase YesM